MDRPGGFLDDQIWRHTFIGTAACTDEKDRRRAAQGKELQEILRAITASFSA
jgi:hypothetical protein